ncbi:GPI inositol-deacylase isoform X7 [Alnus glutinosa]|uniref:GPI inositol-deacylase isoform X7 n=1 Tax=Alnus glutinosa TaxID=3517 RepID=UPI002D799585|nr:GPI inositol-deacylase isoform X7 [Alnus glutinosa]
MQGFQAKFRVATLVVVAVWIGLAALYGLLKPISNGCVMTYMYPTYIPVSSPEGVSSAKYGLYLYHEGWKKIDFKEHLKKLSGVPVLFIPGNGGSYKQVRSVAAESDRAFQGGPLERAFYQEASLTPEEGGLDFDEAGFQLPNRYTCRLDWFAVDLEGEHSAMDGGILEEHTEYVVNAIHRILDQYKASFDVRAKEGAATSGSLPKSVILVGHSMGGFVARAAIVHPRLRKSAVETVLTLSSPHQSPPVALQPSLGHYFAHVNQQWRKGYEVETTRTGRYVSGPVLSNVVIISISGGYHDYQVRTKLESLDGIVPPTNGFMISSTGMRNVWLSMEHQAILWCNQLVVQVSHTLLSLIDSRTGQPFPDTQKRLAIFTRMLRSGLPKRFDWMMQSHLTSQKPKHVPAACPSNVHWSDDGLERDLYIETTTVTVLAMDGRRRWLDIQKLGSNGKSHFIFVTNLAPCSGVRLHLWPEKGMSTSNLPLSSRILEVTSKMVPIPSGPAPTQIEPGSQTEQPPPSAVFWLGPEDMRGFRFLTISVAPRPTVSGRPPPAASMAVGQFYNPEEGKIELPSLLMLQSIYSHKQDMLVKEDHPLALNLSFAISLGLLPVTLSLKTVGCGVKNSGLQDGEAGNEENGRLCKLRCFPPVALVWDDTSGLHIFPNLYSETIVVDSSSALWSSTWNSEKTAVLLLVDPHCSYKTSIDVSVTAAASRFLLLYSPQVAGVGRKSLLHIYSLVYKAVLQFFLVKALVAITLACLVHPALGLFVLLLSHALCCHSMLCSHVQRKELVDYKNKGNDGSQQFTSKFDGRSDQILPLEEKSSNSLDSSKSFGDTQLEMFHHRHGMLILHLVAALMFVPSLVAWLQRIGIGESFPWILDSALCTGVILHGICNSKPEFNSFSLSFPGVPSRKMRLDFVYLVAGYYSYLSGLALAPDRVFYPMATIGLLSFALRIVQRRNRDKGEVNLGSRKHSHRH